MCNDHRWLLRIEGGSVNLLCVRGCSPHIAFGSDFCDKDLELSVPVKAENVNGKLQLHLRNPAR